MHPRAVAQAVVDELEAIEIQKQHSKTAIGMFRHCRHGRAQLLHETVAVRKIRKRVMIRHVLQSCFRATSRRDVLELQDDASRDGRLDANSEPLTAADLAHDGGIAERH